MSKLEKKVAVAACDTCGMLEIIDNELIPAQDPDLDDEQHQNRPPLGRCAIVRDMCGGAGHDFCTGDVYYIGFLTIEQTLTAKLTAAGSGKE